MNRSQPTSTSMTPLPIQTKRKIRVESVVSLEAAADRKDVKTMHANLCDEITLQQAMLPNRLYTWRE